MTILGEKIPCPLHGKAHFVVMEPHPTKHKLAIARCGETVVLQTQSSVSKEKLKEILGQT